MRLDDGKQHHGVSVDSRERIGSNGEVGDSRQSVCICIAWHHLFLQTCKSECSLYRDMVRCCKPSAKLKSTTPAHHDNRATHT